MLNLVIFGAPGSGKGTQSERLIDEYGLYHISTGEVLRKHISDGTELGKLADSYISKGQLIPDELMIEILADILENNPEAEKGIIFDGFPRTIAQAEALNKLLQKHGSEVTAVLGLEVDDDELIDRLVKRGKDSGRSDDNPETIKKRLDVYHSTTSPLREFYQKVGTYHPIKGTGSVEDIFEDIKSRVNSVKEK
ncbi:MAG: adenylate kinase [Muribaculaceae bacterium]|nr:adenylate kinase [Muribaculaceae bacterium]